MQQAARAAIRSRACMDEAGFRHSGACLRRHQQHAVHHHGRACTASPSWMRRVLMLFSRRRSIPIADRRIMLRRQFRLFADRRLQLSAGDRRSSRPGRPRTDRGSPPCCRETAGSRSGREVDAFHLPVLAARGVHVENGQGDRKAFAPVDHPHQVGVLHRRRR